MSEYFQTFLNEEDIFDMLFEFNMTLKTDKAKFYTNYYQHKFTGNKCKFITEFLKKISSFDSNLDLNMNQKNVWDLSHEQRYELYNSWLNLFIKDKLNYTYT